MATHTDRGLWREELSGITNLAINGGPGTWDLVVAPDEVVQGQCRHGPGDLQCGEGEREGEREEGGMEGGRERGSRENEGREREEEVGNT